jgi:hypothetical protein
MPEEIDELLERIQKKHLSEPPGGKRKRNKFFGLFDKIGESIVSFLISHKKFVLVAILCLILVFAGIYVLAKDYLTKRQNYPERNVAFRSTSTVYIAGGSEERGTKEVDQLTETKVYEGGIESKVGTYLFMTTRELRDDIEYFNMDDSQKIRIASATKKPEIVQAGLRIGGSLNFKEQFAEIILSGGSKAPQSYRVYKFVPERGLKEVEVTIVEQADGTTIMENRMIEHREYIVGWRWGKEYRAGTSLEQYTTTPDNKKLIDQFYDHIKTLDSPQTIDRSTREKMVREAMQLSEQIETIPLYLTYEDGFFDLLPQESTIYLAYKPNRLERFKAAFLGKSQHIRLRVENHWDLFPGRYPLLRKFHIGKGENVVYPFDKYNNGGYIVKDKYGDLARIDVQDFILFYGQDVLYSYYFDLNGDGKLDKDNELIGTVLCRTTHDERMDLEKLVGEGKPKTDVTFTIHYSFMTPGPDLQKGMEYFKLCGYIESMMPDQVNRGFGKHSMLGYINEQRSDIMLFKDLTIENMSRALTQESTLVAKYDIVNALIVAKRPYAKDIAEAFGVADQFAGKYQFSDQLVERRDWGMLGGLFLTLAVLVGGVYGIMRRRQGN